MSSSSDEWAWKNPEEEAEIDRKKKEGVVATRSPVDDLVNSDASDRSISISKGRGNTAQTKNDDGSANKHVKKRIRRTCVFDSDDDDDSKGRSITAHEKNDDDDAKEDSKKRIRRTDLFDSDDDVEFVPKIAPPRTRSSKKARLQSNTIRNEPTHESDDDEVDDDGPVKSQKKKPTRRSHQFAAARNNPKQAFLSDSDDSDTAEDFAINETDAKRIKMTRIQGLMQRKQLADRQKQYQEIFGMSKKKLEVWYKRQMSQDLLQTKDSNEDQKPRAKERHLVWDGTAHSFAWTHDETRLLLSCLPGSKGQTSDSESVPGSPPPIVDSQRLSRMASDLVMELQTRREWDRVAVRAQRPAISCLKFLREAIRHLHPSLGFSRVSRLRLWNECAIWLKPYHFPDDFDDNSIDWSCGRVVDKSLGVFLNQTVSFANMPPFVIRLNILKALRHVIMDATWIHLRDLKWAPQLVGSFMIACHLEQSLIMKQMALDLIQKFKNIV